MHVHFFGVGYCRRIQKHRIGNKKNQEILIAVIIQKRILTFIMRANWVLFILTNIGGILFATPAFARGIFFFFFLVPLNFHLLFRTLRKSFKPSQLVSPNVILAKYYVRFFISGIILFILISGHYVNPLGLFVGLSVVVASIFLATILEVKKLIFKEAV